MRNGVWLDNDMETTTATKTKCNHCGRTTTARDARIFHGIYCSFGTSKKTS